MVRAWIWLGLVGVATMACSGSTEKNPSGAAGTGGGATGGAGQTDGGATANHGGTTPGGGGTTSTNHAGASTTGGASTSGGSGTIGDVPLTSFPSTLADVICSRTFECCTADELERNPFGSTEPQCKGNVTGILSLIVGPLAQSQAAGRADYDEAKAKSCLSGYSTTACMDLRDPSATLDDMLGCSDFIVPKVALGKACEQSYECIDSYCENGVCTALKPEQGECLGDDECQSDNCPVDRCAPAAPESGLCSP